MADFITAVNWMKQDKKVRKKCWGDKKVAIRFDRDGFIDWTDDKERDDTNLKYPMLTLEWVDATDWEIFEENVFGCFEVEGEMIYINRIDERIAMYPSDIINLELAIKRARGTSGEKMSDTNQKKWRKN